MIEKPKVKRKVKAVCATETQEQKALIQWLKLKKIFYFSVANGAVLRGNAMQRARQMNKLKSEGLIVGTSDLIVMIKDKILFIELKRVKGSTTSQAQKDFVTKVDKFTYAVGRVCKGAKMAIEFIEEYLND